MPDEQRALDDFGGESAADESAPDEADTDPPTDDDTPTTDDSPTDDDTPTSDDSPTDDDTSTTDESRAHPVVRDETAGSDPVPAAATSSWTGDGAACDACGAVVERRWRDGGALVCPDCKEW